MNYSSALSGDQLIVNLSDEVTFAHNRKFKEMIESIFGSDSKVTGKFKTIVFDLQRVTFIDSAGLGIFILVKDRSDKVGAKVILRKPPTEVRKMLDVARFGKVFTIED